MRLISYFFIYTMFIINSEFIHNFSLFQSFIVIMEPIILVHGGAGYVSDERAAIKLISIRKVARKGYEVLRNTGCVLSATIAAVEMMEDDPIFNAGQVSSFCRYGTQ